MHLRPEATQALNFWVDALNGSGGTGQRAARPRNETRRLMGRCRESVPVWIMPLSRVVQNFDPIKTRFDVVIIDEASQSELTGLIPIYMADKVIVVGDDEQASPNAVGDDTSRTLDLIDSYLGDLPGSKLFDRNYSLYALAKSQFRSTDPSSGALPVRSGYHSLQQCALL